VYEFPTIAEFSVSPHRVLAERSSRTVRRQMIADQALVTSVLRPKCCVPSVLRASELSSSAFSSVALSKRPLRTTELSKTEVRCVSASSVQSMLRQAFSRVAVQRSRPAKVSSSVASSVLTSPTFPAPKRILSSALHISKRAARAEKFQRISQRLAQLK
jgi:hypothetical protein